MAYKNAEDSKNYQRKYYLKFKKPKREALQALKPPRIKKTKEEIMARNKVWRLANPDKIKEMAKRAYWKHKEKRLAARKEWAENNKDYLREYHKGYHKGWYQKNKTKKDAQNKAYSLTHKEDNVKRTQKYVAENKEKVYAYGKRFSQTISGRFRHYVSGAKKRGKEFAITLEDFTEITKLPCYYCGEEIIKRGIDRLNNEIGYLKENCVPACTLCNMMKKIMTKQDFLNHIVKIYKHNQ